MSRVPEFSAHPGAPSASHPPVSHSWHPEGGIPVSHMSATPTGAACLPASLSPLVQTPRGICQPWRGGIRARASGGSSELAGVRVAKSRGTAAPAAALPSPAVTGLLGCAVGDIGGSQGWAPVVVPTGGAVTHGLWCPWDTGGMHQAEPTVGSSPSHPQLFATADKPHSCSVEGLGQPQAMLEEVSLLSPSQCSRCEHPCRPSVWERGWHRAWQLVAEGTAQSRKSIPHG